MIEKKDFWLLTADKVQLPKPFIEKFKDQFILPRLKLGQDFEEIIFEVEQELKWGLEFLECIKTNLDACKIIHATKELSVISHSEIRDFLDISKNSYRSVNLRLEPLIKQNILKEANNLNNETAHRIEIQNRIANKPTSKYFEITKDIGTEKYISESFRKRVEEYKEYLQSAEEELIKKKRLEALKLKEKVEKSKTRFQKIKDALVCRIGEVISIDNLYEYLYREMDVVNRSKSDWREGWVPFLIKKKILSPSKVSLDNEAFEVRVRNFIFQNHIDMEVKQNDEENKRS